MLRISERKESKKGREKVGREGKGEIESEGGREGEKGILEKLCSYLGGQI